MGDILHSFSFKDGIKRARKKMGYTQQSFSVAFGVCIETVRNWEQGRNIPDSVTLKKLCQFFNCSLDYLFFNIDCQNHDIQFIKDKMGLSENTIKNIIKLTKYEQGKRRLTIIDGLLQNSDFTISLTDKIDLYYHRHKEYIEKAKQYVKESKEIRSKTQNDPLRIMEMQGTGEIVTTINRHQLAELENAKDATLFKIQKYFEDIIDETEKYINSIDNNKEIEFYNHIDD